MVEKEYIERGAVVAMLRAITIRVTPIEENRDMFYHDSGWNGASVAAKVEIGKIPAADVVEVVHARWDKDGRCTNCGGHAPFIPNGLYYYESNYCHTCGAKMDGGVNHADA